MSNRTAVWSLLVAKQGQWVTRDEIEKVGGLEGLRRLREAKTTAVGQGFGFEQRRIAGLLEYRLIRLDEQRDLRSIWRCAKCGSEPSSDPQPSTDARDRYRIAWCVPCGNRRAVFQKA